MTDVDNGIPMSGMLDFQSVLVEEIDKYYIENNYSGRAVTNCVLTATTACEVLKKLGVQASIIFVSLYVGIMRRGGGPNTGPVARLNVGEEGVAAPNPSLAPYHCVVLIRQEDPNVLYDPSFLQAYYSSDVLRPYVPLQKFPKYNVCSFKDLKHFRNFRNCAGSVSSTWSIGSKDHYLHCNYEPHRKAAQKQHFRRSPDALIVRRKDAVANILQRYANTREASAQTETSALNTAISDAGLFQSGDHSCG